jgi:adenosylcobinamide-GDP ribazoletransferase
MRRALAFLTPIGGAAPPSPAAMSWFPVAGALIGVAVGGAWWGADHIWPAAVAAAIAVIVDLALTGLLHIDGVGDTADGLLPHLDTQRRLDVMTEPQMGAFGVTAIVVTVLLRFAAFAAMTPSVLAIAGIWCASRTAMAVAARALPYARSDGLASAFLGGSPVVVAFYGIIGAGVLAGIGRQGPGVAAVAATLVGAGAVLWFAHRRIGGFTGDVLGACGVVGETLGLLVLAAKW